MDETADRPRVVTLVTREGCCLCVEAHAVLVAMHSRIPFTLEVVDVDSDPDLARMYGEEVPVVLIDGRKAQKGHLDADGLARRLRGEGIFRRSFGPVGPR